MSIQMNNLPSSRRSDRIYVGVNRNDGINENKKDQRSCKQYFIIFTLMILFTMTIVFGTLACLYHFKIILQKEWTLCESEQCIKTALQFKKFMNVSVDPCSDFYRYSCGKYIQSIQLNTYKSGDYDDEVDYSMKLQEELDEDIHYDDTKAVREAKILYKSCIDRDKIGKLELNPLYELLEELGLPKIPGIFTGETVKTNFTSTMVLLEKIINTPVLFSIEITENPRNTSEHIVILGSMDLEDEEKNIGYFRKLRRKTRRLISKYESAAISGPRRIMDEAELKDKILKPVFLKAFKSKSIKSMNNTINAILNLQNAEPNDITNNTGVSKEKIYEVSRKIYEFQENFIDIFPDLRQRFSMFSEDNYFTISEIHSIISNHVHFQNSSIGFFNFKDFMRNLIYTENDDLQIDKKVIVSNISQLKEAALKLNSEDPLIIESLLWWLVVKFFVPYSPNFLREAYEGSEEFNATLLKIPSDCTKIVSENMAFAASRMIVDDKFHNSSSKARMVKMVENIKSVFTIAILSSKWIDRESKKRILAKKDRIEAKFGYQSWLFDNKMLNKYYEWSNMSEDHYFANIVLSTKSQISQQISKLNDPTKKFQDEELVPTEEDALAYYTEESTSMSFPFVTMQRPDSQIQALNYGALGVTIGHELTHGFDDIGIKHDEKGNLNPEWLSEQVMTNYSIKAECYLRQYSNFLMKLDTIKFRNNDIIALGENIADNVGMKLAFDAYKIWQKQNPSDSRLAGFSKLSSEQLFFLQYAMDSCAYEGRAEILNHLLQDNHAFGRSRVFGALQNSVEFSKAWNCPIGSRMNPTDKCRLW